MHRANGLPAWCSGKSFDRRSAEVVISSVMNQSEVNQSRQGRPIPFRGSGFEILNGKGKRCKANAESLICTAWSPGREAVSSRKGGGGQA
ncbi:hypothetical protein KCP70_15485 [Salmonella enterica subsp. enterica]|nr:hypothetical protein KCP70_15485 [Salmonella enterica subsp. enterica]